MIVGIGCDIVNYTLTKKLNWESNRKVLERIFSLQELNLYDSNKTLKFLTGRFAAKEAVLKCLGNGMQDGFSLTDIEILQTEEGKPIVNLNGKVSEISESLNIKIWHVTISHSPNESIAFLIAEC